MSVRPAADAKFLSEMLQKVMALRVVSITNAAGRAEKEKVTVGVYLQAAADCARTAERIVADLCGIMQIEKRLPRTEIGKLRDIAEEIIRGKLFGCDIDISPECGKILREKLENSVLQF